MQKQMSHPFILRFLVAHTVLVYLSVAATPALAAAVPIKIWWPLPKLTGIEGETADYLGSSVAMDGDRVVAGAPDSYGAVYVYERADSWGFTARLQNFMGGAEDDFGAAVDVDGEWVIAGCPGEDDRGSAIFFLHSGAWGELHRVSDSSGSDGDRFGAAVAIYGSTAAVGAPYYDNGSLTGAGAAYIYQRVEGPPYEWVLAAKIEGTAENEHLGGAVALRSNTILIGAPGRAAGAYGGVGAVDVYTLVSGVISYASTITAESGDAFPGDCFGTSIAISSTAVVIGSPQHDTGGVNNSGAAFVFTGGAGSYSFADKLEPDDPAELAFFGADVDAYGSLIVVGAPGDDDDTGAAYLYQQSGGSWPQKKKFLAYDGDLTDRFGTDVAVDDDVVMVGSPFNDVDTLGADAGAVYPFEKRRWDLAVFDFPSGASARAFEGIDWDSSYYAVGEAHTPTGDWVACLWEETGGQWEQFLLPDLVGGSRANALAVWNGTVFYAAGTVLDEAGNWQPSIWSHEWPYDDLTVLPKPPGAISAEVLSLSENALGWLVATGSATTAAGVQVATRWFSPGPGEWYVASLPPLVPGMDSVACDFIESGGAMVIGYAHDELDQRHAVIWDKDGPIWQLTVLPNLPGGEQSAAFSGTSCATPLIAGWYQTAGGERHAVRWVREDQEWSLLDIGLPEGFENSAAIACAWPDDWEMPWLTGFADSGAGTAEAMLWLTQGPAAEVIDLNEIVEDQWIIRRATSISQSGRITAWGVLPGAEDEPQAFVLAMSVGSDDVGDLNCDGAVDFFDIDAIVLALTDPEGYAETYPDCDIMLADANGDGVVDFFDIDPLVAILTGS